MKNDPNDVATHTNYGSLLSETGRLEESEKHYKFALENEPKNINVHSNYGYLLSKMGRFEEAEKHYKFALEANPDNTIFHLNYGLLLLDIGRFEEAENEYKLAIKLDPEFPNSHGAYGSFLFYINSEKKAIKETVIASRLYREKGDLITEHLSLAWLYEQFASKYYTLGNYQKSGMYAELSGDEYIAAGNHAGEKLKSTSLIKGYTLKGRAKIRKLKIKPSFYERTIKRIIRNKVSDEIETLTRIMDCIAEASKYYKMAADLSPERNHTCNACSISMLCLSDMLDYMLKVIKTTEEVPKLEYEIENWKNKLIVCREIYKGNQKGEAFIQSLDKLMDCIKNLYEYKKYGMGRMKELLRNAFGNCRKLT